MHSSYWGLNNTQIHKKTPIIVGNIRDGKHQFGYYQLHSLHQLNSTLGSPHTNQAISLHIISSHPLSQVWRTFLLKSISSIGFSHSSMLANAPSEILPINPPTNNLPTQIRVVISKEIWRILADNQDRVISIHYLTKGPLISDQCCWMILLSNWLMEGRLQCNS